MKYTNYENATRAYHAVKILMKELSQATGESKASIKKRLQIKLDESNISQPETKPKIWRNF